MTAVYSPGSRVLLALRAWPDADGRRARLGGREPGRGGQFGHVPGSLCVLVSARRLWSWKPGSSRGAGQHPDRAARFTHNLATVNDGGVFISLWLTTVLYSFTLGTRCSRAASVAAIAGLVVSPSISSSILLQSRPGNADRRTVSSSWGLPGRLPAPRRAPAAPSGPAGTRCRTRGVRRRIRPLRTRSHRPRIARHRRPLREPDGGTGQRRMRSWPRLISTGPVSRSPRSVSAARQASDEITLLVQLLADSPPEHSPG